MLTIINIIANIVITLSGLIFFLLLYGNDSTRVHKWSKVSHWALKSGLSFFIAGSFYSALAGMRVPFPQVLTNVGLACILAWAVVFHYKILKPSGNGKG
jgi:hypothetical protein